MQFHPRRLKTAGHGRQKTLGLGLVDNQGLHGIADARPLDLGVKADIFRRG